MRAIVVMRGDVMAGTELTLENVRQVVREEIWPVHEKVVALAVKVTVLDEKVVALDEKVLALDGKVTGLDEKVTGLETRLTSVQKMLEEDAQAESKRLDLVDRRSRKTQRLLRRHVGADAAGIS